MSAQSRKGASFERVMADWFRDRLGDDRIDRRVKRGAKDTGDIAGLRTIRGGKIVAEVKNRARMDLAGWVDEAEAERGNDDALIGVVVHKRKGVGDPSQQYVTMTAESLALLIEGGFDDRPVFAEKDSTRIGVTR